MTIALVTGGAGFVGSHLVDALLAEGKRVRVLDNLLEQAHPTGEARFLSPDAELMVADLRDEDAVARALEGVNVVFHLGGMVGNGQSMVQIRRYTDVNVTGTATLLEALVARRDRIERLVLGSSMVVYGDGSYACPEHGDLAAVVRERARLVRGAFEPICPTCGAEVEPRPTREEHTLAPTSAYGSSKLAQESLCLAIGSAYQLPTVALRYLNIYGSRQALSNPYTGVAAIMTTRLLNGRPPTIFEDGRQRRDLVHVSDIVRATLAAATAEERAWYKAINVGTGSSITVLEMARALAGALESSIEPDVTGAFREGDIRHCYADVDRARSLLGWEARVPFSEGVGELVRWARDEAPTDHTERANAELRERGMLR
jgi:dTDP-L-rhamnose 4-epimerase